mmetsp:Transcript_63104/g.148644  ORF Transcript_63104/g.148644 Transcript_63104/m.148644 type:complete len:290 (+) Transcript_63104:428-1297(+)
MRRLQAVFVAFERRDVWRHPLARSDLVDDQLAGRVGLQRVARHQVPVGEDHVELRLARGFRSEDAFDAEGLSHGQEPLDGEERHARPAFLVGHLPAAAVEPRVDGAEAGLWALDLDLEDRLDELRLGRVLRREHGAARGRNDLPGAPVHGVGVEHHVKDREAHAPQALLGQHSLLAHPLEGRHDVLLAVRQVLHAMGAVAQHVGAVKVGSKRPHLAGNIELPVVGVDQRSSPREVVVHRGDVACLDRVGQLGAEREGRDPHAVVLVVGLGQAGLWRLDSDGLAVVHDRL